MEKTQSVKHRSNVVVIDTHYSRPQFAASHLLIEKGKAAFIDVGTTLSAGYLLNALDNEGLGPDDVRYIILTHIHLDHAGGAGELMRKCTNATLIVHPKGAPHMINPEKLVKASIAIYGEERFSRLYGEIPAIAPERVTTVNDGDVLDFQGRTLHFLDTPGHARHHCCIWDPASRGIFSGDTMGFAYPELQEPHKAPFLMPTTSPAAFEPDRLEESIRRLQSFNPETYYLTHFGPVGAHPDSVDLLIRQVRQHAELGRQSRTKTSERLRSGVRDIFYKAYCSYKGETVDRDQFSAFLSSDIELNSQGIEIWAKRQQNSDS